MWNFIGCFVSANPLATPEVLVAAWRYAGAILVLPTLILARLDVYD